MIAVIIAAAVAVMTVGNAEHAFDRADSAADAGTDDASDRTTHGTGDPVTFVGAFLGPAHDTLGMAGVRQSQQRKQDGGGSEQQADGQAGRQLRGGDTSFVHLQSQGRYTG